MAYRSSSKGVGSESVRRGQLGFEFVRSPAPAALTADQAALIAALVAAASFAAFTTAAAATGLLSATALAALIDSAALTVGIFLFLVRCHCVQSHSKNRS